jgi:hypothetical protein
MPNRIIKESIWTSPNLNHLSWEAERHFYRIMPCPDDHGCCECSPAVIKGKCYPLQDNVTAKHIEQWQTELEKEKLIFRWINGSRQYAIFPTFSEHQRIRSLHNRKTPEPPKSIVDKCRQVSPIDSNRQQRDATDDKGDD